MKSNRDSAESPVSYTVSCDALANLIDHEPPIGVGEGPEFDIPGGNSLDDPPPPLAAGGPYTYYFKSLAEHPAEYTCIANFAVITEENGGHVKMTGYKLPESEGAKLHLWFSENDAPDLIFEGTGTASGAKLTMPEQLDPRISRPSNRARPYRRVCSKPDLKIKRWALVGKDDEIIKDPVSGANLGDYGDSEYHFYINFHHAHTHTHTH